ncbi:cobalamin synthesis protein CbiX [Nitzschia inconspicua]|uniref:Cobalamin synthesis protein CbiX n=1 Tax=Nitzschia inconspicua TaxID=303405 RepID=A0A9K3PCN1_9STRA|nr:cobalamin synthesis protein CbiX [Nitzschia inconspicua]KAG7364049.1 cobalamin synthesis protein CbiX [Nitzschia inconspicua]
MLNRSNGSTSMSRSSEPPYYTGNVQLMEARLLELSSSLRALYRSNRDLEDALLEAPNDRDFMEAISENKALMTKQKKELTQVVRSMKNLGANVEVPDDIQVMDIDIANERVTMSPSPSCTAIVSSRHLNKFVARTSWRAGVLLLLMSCFKDTCALVGWRNRFASQRTFPASSQSRNERTIELPLYKGWKSTKTTSHQLPGLFLSATGRENEELDLFDYFDPLLSPHAYPGGISPNSRPKEHQGTAEDTTLPKKIGFTLPITAADEMRQTSASATMKSSNSQQQDLFDYFDPLLSPHAYPQGISPENKPNQLKEDNFGKPVRNMAISSKRVGILIMDHGSKKSASNARLQALADLYQSSMDEQYEYDGIGQRQVLVKAAHMEIASPSIPDGLRALRDAGVDEIICHPFFLSPDGRHVKEDIPEIIDGAIESLNIQIPVITTSPVGSNISLMLNAVHSLVVESSNILDKE